MIFPISICKWIFLLYTFSRILNHIDVNKKMVRLHFWKDSLDLKNCTHQYYVMLSLSLFADGSGNHSHYRYVDAGDQHNLFMSTMTVLRLQAEFFVEGCGSEKRTLWENLMPNSPYAISPLRLKFEKETTGMIFLFLSIFQWPFYWFSLWET